MASFPCFTLLQGKSSSLLIPLPSPVPHIPLMHRGARRGVVKFISVFNIVVLTSSICPSIGGVQIPHSTKSSNTRVQKNNNSVLSDSPAFKMLLSAKCKLYTKIHFEV